MSTPRRVQRQRTKGWRMPENTVYVGRGTKWGNPYRMGRAGQDGWCVQLPDDGGTTVGFGPHVCPGGTTRLAAAQEAVRLYAETEVEYELGSLTRADIRTELAGKNLSCWCPLDQPCHADVLLEVANREVVTA